MTYRELKEKLIDLNEEQLDMDVTVCDIYNDEYFAASLDFTLPTNSVLDEGHPVFVFREEL